MAFPEKFISVILLAVMLHVSGCAQDTMDKDSIQVQMAEELSNEQNSFMFGHLDDPYYYLRDFPTTVKSSDFTDFHNTMRAGGDLFTVRRLAGPHDPDILIVNYPKVKSFIQQYLDLPAGALQDGRLMGVQITGQKILRRLFLLKERRQQSLGEIKFLLDAMVTAGSIDLDVLTDAYWAIEGNISDEDDSLYRTYLQKVHDDVLAMVRLEVDKFRETDETIAADDPARLPKLTILKRFESLTKSCQYYRRAFDLPDPVNHD